MERERLLIKCVGDMPLGFLLFAFGKGATTLSKTTSDITTLSIRTISIIILNSVASNIK